MKSCGNMWTGLISFHTVINVHNTTGELDQGLLGVGVSVRGIFVEDLLQRKYVQHVPRQITKLFR